jgi:DnaJ homolog subfamily B member 12
MFTTLMGLLPILFLFVLPLLSSLFSGGSAPAAPGMYFDNPVHPFTAERITPNLNVRYYTNPKDIQGYSAHKLSQLDKTAEVTLVKKLRLECEHEQQQKLRLVEQAQGWFFQDPEKMEIARKFEMRSCKRLETLGVPR